MENNPTGENISQNPTVAPTTMPVQPQATPVAGVEALGQPVQAQVPSEGGVSAEAAQAPASAPTEAVLAKQNAGMAGNPGMAPGAMPMGASLRPETMQSQKVTKSIKLPGAKKSHKGLVTVIIIVLVLALGAGAAWWFMAGPGKTEGKQETDEISNDEKRPSGDGSSGPISTRPNYGGGSDTEITPEEEERRVREVVEMMRARAVEFLAEKGLTTDIALTEISEGGGIYVRPDDWGAAVSSTKSIGYVAANGIEGLQLDLLLESDNIAQALYEENGFQSYGFVGIGYALKYNPETGVYCAHEAGVGMFDVSCAYKTWVDESQKETVNQMAVAYLAGMGDEVKMLSIDMANLENSPVAPYQRIWVSIPNAAASFHRVSPEAEWKFFRAGQDAASCEEYNTDELKNAYAGMTCYSRDGEYTVEAAN